MTNHALIKLVNEDSCSLLTEGVYNGLTVQYI